MTLNLFIQCFLIGLLGIAFQTLLKIQTLKSKAKAANIIFKAVDYFREDYPAIGLNFISLGVFIIAIDEIVMIKPVIMEYIKFFYFFVGVSGSWIINTLLSNVNKKIMRVIDEKTNAADSMSNTPPVEVKEIPK